MLQVFLQPSNHNVIILYSLTGLCPSPSESNVSGCFLTGFLQPPPVNSLPPQPPYGPPTGYQPPVYPMPMPPPQPIPPPYVVPPQMPPGQPPAPIPPPSAHYPINPAPPVMPQVSRSRLLERDYSNLCRLDFYL